MVVKESFGDSVRPYPPIGGDGTQASGVEFVVALYPALRTGLLIVILLRRTCFLFNPFRVGFIVAFYPALRTGLFIVVLLRRTFLHCIQSREGLNNK